MKLTSRQSDGDEHDKEHTIPGFISKLLAMINDPSIKHLISWTEVSPVCVVFMFHPGLMGQVQAAAWLCCRLSRKNVHGSALFLSSSLGCSYCAQKGDTFKVHNANHLAQEVLPKYYKHRNFTSLVRQLNMCTLLTPFLSCDRQEHMMLEISSRTDPTSNIIPFFFAPLPPEKPFFVRKL
jgi:hypothetical protein